MTTGTMTTGSFILVIIALLGIAIATVAIWQCLKTRDLINYYFRISERQRRDILNAINGAANYTISPESATSKGTITPPSSFSDIELRKYCIEQTNKDQVYLRIEDAQRLYEFIKNGKPQKGD